MQAMNRLFGKTRKPAKPHIILLMTDQHRGDALRCTGNPAVISPNIDSLAADGTLFTNGYSSVPSSTPARTGLLTGLSPWHHGMLGYGRVASGYNYEMPKMLLEAGYYTFGIGKMHWYPQKSLHGFHATLVDESGRAETPDFISDYRAWFQLQAPGQNPDLTGIGWNEHRAGIYRSDEKLHPTAWTGQTACELIRNYNSDKPLFLKVSFARPHSPYDPPQRYLDMYRNAEIPAPVIGDWCGKYGEKTDPAAASKDAPWGNFGEEYSKNSRRHYYANITFIDDQIGEIIHELKQKGMYEHALICFTADHGDMLGDHYHWRKTYAYEGSAKIPYIVKWPENNRINVKKSDAPVELRDFLPTFLDVAGVEIPAGMDGKSLLQLVTQPKPQWRKYIDLEHAQCYGKDNYWCALTDGKLKYIRFFGTGEELLFDLEKDPGELTNRAGLRACQRQLDTMRNEMIAHLTERGDGFVKDGKLVTRAESLLYSPNYPGRHPDSSV
ncbi:MAG: arylsulfatase [Bacteroidales bacterium]|nr:arylsulfatase [Bacteroidales bacterium]